MKDDPNATKNEPALELTATGLKLFAEALERHDRWACSLLESIERFLKSFSELLAASKLD